MHSGGTSGGLGVTVFCQNLPFKRRMLCVFFMMRIDNLNSHSEYRLHRRRKNHILYSFFIRNYNGFRII